MAEIDTDVAVTESFEDPMVPGADVFQHEKTAERECIVKRELGLEKVQEKEILGFTVEPTQVYMDDIDRLDRSFYSSGVLGSEDERVLPDEVLVSEVKGGVVVSEIVSDIKINMRLETKNRGLEGNSLASETISLKAESLDQGVGVIEEEHLVTDTVQNWEKLGGALSEEAAKSDVNYVVEVLERVPEIKICTMLEATNGVLEGSTSAAETNSENLENLEDVPAGDKVAEAEDKSFDENQELETERETHSCNEETINVDENKVLVMDEDIVDTVGEVPVTKDEKTSSGFSKEDEIMEPVVEVSADDGQLIEEGLKPSQDCGDGLEETTGMEVEEELIFEEKVAGEDDFHDNSVEEGQDLFVGEIEKDSFTEETQVVAMTEEFPPTEVDGEVTLEIGKENLASETKSEVDGDKYLNKDKEQLKTAEIENADAEQVGINGRSDSSVIDSQEILQVPTDNASHKLTSVLENAVESKNGTSGETLVDDPSTVEDQTANFGNVSEFISPSMGPSEIEHENLESHMARNDQPSAAHLSPSVGTSETEPQNLENLETCMVGSDLPSDTRVSDVISSDENVVTEEIIESYEAVEHDSQGMVLNRCTHGSLVVDLDICLDKDKELVKEDVRLEEVESHLMTDAEFSEYFDGSANANGEICLGTEVQEKYTVEDPDIEMSEQITEPEQGNDVEVKISKETTLRPSGQIDLANHLLPEESEAKFSVSDLVWGKVKSHPWWPGQIFDPEDASEKAMQHHKKDSFLVAYFGDRTFAWNEASVLKPFWSNFSHIEKQSSSEVFQTAINSTLDEVSRRNMLGLACSCIPNGIYSKVECQIVENTGIRQESSRRYDLDESMGASFFRPNKLVEYMRALAESPSAGTDRLGLVIAKAQLLAFNQMRGHYSLPEFQYCGGLLESDDADISALDQENESTPHENSNKGKLKSENRTSHKRKHNLKDGSYSSKRERRLSELMGDGGSVEQDKRISFYAAKVSSTASPTPKPSFKVGDCIRRAASQLTGSLSILRNGNENPQKVDGIVDSQIPPANSQTSPVKNSSLDEMLLQLQMLAQDPVKDHSFGNSITGFFSGFRDSIHLCQFAGRQSSVMGKPGGGRKRRMSHGFVGSPEEFEFDDVSDSYWTDMIIQNHSEEQPGSFLKHGQFDIVTLDSGKSRKSSQKGNSRKRFSTGNHHEMVVDEPMSYIDQMRQANLPTELILNFSETDSVPTETHINKTLRRFGPLKETETEIDPESSRARVVFKRCSDAEVAYNSAGKFSIFGPVFVNYQLSYTPSNSFNTFPLATSEGMEDAG